MSDRSALVTGAHGFIGRNVARGLARRGFVVRGIGHGTWKDGEWREWGLQTWTACDVDLEALARHGGEAEVIVHCAGGASVAAAEARPMDDFRRAVDTTLSVLDYVRSRSPGSRVVFLSSAAVYGTTDNGPVGEDAPLAPVSAYAMHKLAAERLCTEYGALFAVRSSIVRFFSVIGTGLRKQLLWDACNKLSRGERTFSGTGKETRDWLAVEDAVDLIVTAAAHATERAPVVNGATGTVTTVNDILTELAESMGVTEGPVFSGEVRRGDPARLEADVSCARSWGWEPRIHWRTAARRYSDWFLRGAS